MLITRVVRNGPKTHLNVPKDIRAHLGINPGDLVLWTPIKSGGVMLTNVTGAIEKFITPAPAG